MDLGLVLVNVFADNNTLLQMILAFVIMVPVMVLVVIKKPWRHWYRNAGQVLVLFVACVTAAAKYTADIEDLWATTVLGYMSFALVMLFLLAALVILIEGVWRLILYGFEEEEPEKAYPNDDILRVKLSHMFNYLRRGSHKAAHESHMIELKSATTSPTSVNPIMSPSRRGSVASDAPAAVPSLFVANATVKKAESPTVSSRSQMSSRQHTSRSASEQQTSHRSRQSVSISEHAAMNAFAFATVTSTSPRSAGTNENEQPSPKSANIEPSETPAAAIQDDDESMKLPGVPLNTNSAETHTPIPKTGKLRAIRVRRRESVAPLLEALRRSDTSEDDSDSGEDMSDSEEKKSDESW